MKSVTARMPWLTLGVLVVTAATTAAMYRWPAIVTALQRSPAMPAGEYWRFVTAWLVQVDGLTQIVANGLGLVVFGTIVERRVGGRWWFAAYVAAGLAGEIAGIYWQPFGGGNSVAVLGLFALFCVTQLERGAIPLPARIAPLLVAVVGAVWLISQRDIHGIALATGLVLAGSRALSLTDRTV